MDVTSAVVAAGTGEGKAPHKPIFVGNFGVVGNFTTVRKTIPFCPPDISLV